MNNNTKYIVVDTPIRFNGKFYLIGDEFPYNKIPKSLEKFLSPIHTTSLEQTRLGPASSASSSNSDKSKKIIQNKKRAKDSLRSVTTSIKPSNKDAGKTK